MEPKMLSISYSEVPYKHFEQSIQPIEKRMGLEICATTLHGALIESELPKLCQVNHLDKLINYPLTLLILFTQAVKIYGLPIMGFRPLRMIPKTKSIQIWQYANQFNSISIKPAMCQPLC